MSSNSETVLETFWLFPEHYGFCILKNHKYPFIYWEMWSGCILVVLNIFPVIAVEAVVFYSKIIIKFFEEM